MTDEIIKKDEVCAINVHAEDNGVVVGHADSFAPTFNLFLPGGKRTSMDQSYFNLIIGYSPLEKDYIIIARQRALKEYISDDVRSEFSTLDEKAVEKIKKMPAIISSEREDDDGQQAAFAFITDIKIQDNGYKIYFQRFFTIPFSFLIENQSALAMHNFELTRTHWTIKKVDLIEVMHEAGVFPGGSNGK